MSLKTWRGKLVVLAGSNAEDEQQKRKILKSVREKMRAGQPLEGRQSP